MSLLPCLPSGTAPIQVSQVNTHPNRDPRRNNEKQGRFKQQQKLTVCILHIARLSGCVFRLLSPLFACGRAAPAAVRVKLRVRPAEPRHWRLRTEQTVGRPRAPLCSPRCSQCSGQEGSRWGILLFRGPRHLCPSGPGRCPRPPQDYSSQRALRRLHLRPHKRSLLK